MDSESPQAHAAVQLAVGSWRLLHQINPADRESQPATSPQRTRPEPPEILV